MIKNDATSIALDHAMEDYERCEELMSLIGEYNAQQEMLGGADNAEDVRKKVSDRIDELYREITEHAVYKAYIEAKAAFDEFYHEVMGEVQFGVTRETVRSRLLLMRRMPPLRLKLTAQKSIERYGMKLWL